MIWTMIMRTIQMTLDDDLVKSVDKLVKELKTTALMNQLPNAIDWPVPEKHRKDPGEAWKRISLEAWVKSGLKRYSTLNKKD